MGQLSPSWGPWRLLLWTAIRDREIWRLCAEDVCWGGLAGGESLLQGVPVLYRESAAGEFGRGWSGATGEKSSWKLSVWS